MRQLCSKFYQVICKNKLGKYMKNKYIIGDNSGIAD